MCEPLYNAGVDLKRYPHLKTLDFAMDLEYGGQFTSDQYWTLLTGKIIKSDDGPVALNSHLGWMLSGPVVVRESMNLH